MARKTQQFQAVLTLTFTWEFDAASLAAARAKFENARLDQIWERSQHVRIRGYGVFGPASVADETPEKSGGDAE